MKTINREQFLHILESVSPGLTDREIIQQSSCFIFRNGYVSTFNDEIACRMKCDIGFECAVQAKPLMSIIGKLTEEELHVWEDMERGEFAIKGKGRKSGIVRESDIQIPSNVVEKPEEWRDLPEGFSDAIGLTKDCASTNAQQFRLTCIHIAPNWVESCDNAQGMRFKLKTGVKKPFLVRSLSIKHVAGHAFTKIAETSNWVHFRNPKGLMFSCRRSTETYYDLTKMFEFKGTPINLPKGLKSAADRASVFLDDNGTNPKVQVDIVAGKGVRVRGVGMSGWFQEIKNLKYKGDPLNFHISPELLMDIVEKYNEAEISDSKLKVSGGNWVYISHLAKKQETPKDE